MVAFFRFYCLQDYIVRVRPEAEDLIIILDTRISHCRDNYEQYASTIRFLLSSPEIVGSDKEELFAFVDETGLGTVAIETMRQNIRDLALEAINTVPEGVRGDLMLSMDIHICIDKLVNDSEVRTITKREYGDVGEAAFRDFLRLIIVDHTPRYDTDNTMEDDVMSEDESDDEDMNEDIENDHWTELAITESFTTKFTPASESAIKSLKVTQRGIKEENKCSIWLEGFMAEETMATLPCNHEFHSECAVQWLRTSHVCPLCRFRLPCEN